MQYEITQLRDFIKRNGLSQAELARGARVSQATVSRALAGKLERHGGAKKRLFEYVEKNSNVKHALKDPRTRIIATFDKIWNHTDAHAEAILRVMHSLGGLEPKRK